ncbi:hypothetical protein COO60DRAFT_1633364 [Scenedesmus sp. NREL 46B-D3]|nr:hypothetical protein COO60DRAFT_1633364 [Scenedesmus sp. NREL 46B-D3]
MQSPPAGQDPAPGAAANDPSAKLPIWRRLTRNFSQGVDAVIDGILQDNDVVVVVDKPHCFAKDDRVLPHTSTFRARNQVLVPFIRRLFALLCVAGMAAWLLVDILYKDADGLVPGLRDTYIIDSRRFDPDEQPHHDSSTTSVCTCTYSTASSAYGQPPYVSLVLNKGHERPGFDTYLGYCDEPPGGQALFNFSAPDGELLMDVLEEYFFYLGSLRMESPTSAIMLPEEGWKAARMHEAQRGFYAALTAARRRLTAPKVVLNDQQQKVGLMYVALLHAAFTKALGRLLEMPDFSTTVEMVNAARNTSTPLNCSRVPSKEELPLVLSEWCVPVPGQPAVTADDGDVERNCGDPYGAYVQWCAPALCHTLEPKSRYLQAVQIMSAIGGVYSIIAMFAFAIVWRLFRSLERCINIDEPLFALCEHVKAWLPGAGSWRQLGGGATVTQQSLTGVQMSNLLGGLQAKSPGGSTVVDAGDSV